MDFKIRLSSRIGMNEIHEITHLTQDHDSKKQELYDLLFDEEDSIAYNAAWVLTHLSLNENRWMYDKQDELIDEVFVCKHKGKCRLILTLLYRQPLSSPPRVDFLDFCLERMASQREPVAIQSICMKLAYELCRSIPELLQELKGILSMMEPSLLTPATQSARNKILKVMNTGKSLQTFLYNYPE